MLEKIQSKMQKVMAKALVISQAPAIIAIDPRLAEVTNAPAWPKKGCAECMELGGVWVHLNMCRTCGHVGCCDNSPAQHSQQHFHETGHSIIQRYEPGEDWGWDWKAGQLIRPFPAPIASSERHPVKGYKTYAKAPK